MKKLIPYITEKTVLLTKDQKFTLLVDYNTTKKEVEGLVKQYYKVNPISINVIRTKYLTAMKRKKVSLDRGMKKVIVKLPKDQKITGFEFDTKEDTKKEVKKETKKIDKKEKDGKES